MNMEDGGLCGGRAPTALYSPRRLFYTTSTQICTPTRCHRRSRITLCGKGTNSTRSFLHFLQLVNCSRHIFLILHRNCEDIAMSFLVANTTGSPPIWVQGKLNVLHAFLPIDKPCTQLSIIIKSTSMSIMTIDVCLLQQGMFMKLDHQASAVCNALLTGETNVSTI